MKKKTLLLAFAVLASFAQAKKNGFDHSIINSVENPYLPFYYNPISYSNHTNLFGEHVILDEPFENFTDNGWTTYSVAGPQIWTTTNFGHPAPSALMNGYTGVNEDWLISKNIDLTNGYTSASFSFMTDGRYAGNPLEVYITTNAYTNGAAPNTVTWTKLNAVFDLDLNSFAGFVSSGDIDLTTYLGKNVRIAFKYTNESSMLASSWEIDNFKVVATNNLSVADASSSKMKVYPNPAKDILNFSEEISNVKITDFSGKVVKEASVIGKSVDISKLAKGVYIIKVTVRSGETITNKIVKE